MNGDMTVAELKAHCMKQSEKYSGEDDCIKCDFKDLGCCSPPDTWNVSEPPARPNWERMYHDFEARFREMRADYEMKIDALHHENVKLRTIVGTVETILGRKFEW